MPVVVEKYQMISAAAVMVGVVVVLVAMRWYFYVLCGGWCMGGR